MNETVKCPTCKTAVSVPDLNVAIINRPDMSMMYCVHVSGVDCPKCDAYLLPSIVNLPNGIFGWVPAERPVKVEVPKLVSLH